MDVNEILNKYSKRLNNAVKSDSESNGGQNKIISQNYTQFKNDMMPSLSRYEKWARSLGNFVKLKLSLKDEKRVNKSLVNAHLDLEPSEVVGLAFFSFLGLFVIDLLISTAIYLITDELPLLFAFLMLLVSLFLFYYLYTFPSRLSIRWKLKASSQMVPAILYTVIYMKHTSNLERAISFVAQHVDAPLSLDLKKVIWDVETGKYSNVKDSLDAYLEFWRESNMEFVESFHLIESSLYEPNEARRVQILERALKVILDGVYEKMLKYTHTVKSPLTNLYMLGIVLPTLGLALLPLASALLQGALKASHVFVMFNLLIPFLVFYLTMQIMLKRPGGHGETTLLQKNPMYHKYKSKRPYAIAALICVPILILGLLPLIMQYTPLPGYFGLEKDFALSKIGMGAFGGNAFDYEDNNGTAVGPFGFLALILSLLVPLSFALFFALAFRFRTKDLIKYREQTKDLEKEFNNSLFTLGNRLGDGVPAEIAFAKVAESTKGQKTSEFFKVVNSNIQSMGMGLEEAIFNNRRGAIIYYPSNLIGTSMRILVESVKKGLMVAAQSLISISEYVRNLQKINERLNDLLADVVSDMKSNMTFLAPLLAGIVVGLTSMITAILSHISNLIAMGEGESGVLGVGTAAQLGGLFNKVGMVPPYFMQIAIGIYIVQIIFILTGTLVTVDAGEDKLRQSYEVSKNLIRGMMLYLIVAFIAIVALSALAMGVLPPVGG
ncbi:hypothetical protein GOV14_00825 [Candidatus Pacearchaeota archaeon]|nr:hypothetical protein [Candidatus Pacearchaeota archaeon]